MNLIELKKSIIKTKQDIRKISTFFDSLNNPEEGVYILTAIQNARNDVQKLQRLLNSQLSLKSFLENKKGVI